MKRFIAVDWEVGVKIVLIGGYDPNGCMYTGTQMCSKMKSLNYYTLVHCSFLCSVFFLMLSGQMLCFISRLSYNSRFIVSPKLRVCLLYNLI